MNTKIALSGMSILAALALIGGATFAFFSDNETSGGNTVTAGTLDLKVNGTDDPLAIVKIDDMKPSFEFLVEKTLEVIDNPAQLYLHIKDVRCDGGGDPSEPEADEENGVPRCDIDTVIDYDLGVIDPASDPILTLEDARTIADVTSCWIPLGTIPAETRWILEQSFHMRSNTTNWAQGDILTFAEEFLALQTNAPTPAPPDASGRVWNPLTKSCETPAP